jgi:uncharacterized protein YkwD
MAATSRPPLFRSARSFAACARSRTPAFGRLFIIRLQDGEVDTSRVGRRVVLVTAIGALLAVLLPTTGSPRTAARPVRALAASAPSLESMAHEIVHLVNLERAQHRLKPLKVNTRLVADASLQATQIASTGMLEHVILSAPYPTPQTRAKAAGYEWNVLGENLALGFTDASSAVAAWMQSPGHRANILADSYSETGVVLRPDAHGRLIFVQTFGAPE